MDDKFNKRREYVNAEFSKKISGKSMSLNQRSIMMKKIWKEAKRKYP